MAGTSTKPTTASQLLEITIVSAQTLKRRRFNLNRLKTYAVAWVDSDSNRKLRTTIQSGPDPTWNSKLTFPVPSDEKNSFINVEVYAVGLVKDRLIGAARLPVCDIISGDDGLSSKGFFSLSACSSKGHVRLGISNGLVNVKGKVVNDCYLSVRQVSEQTLVQDKTPYLDIMMMMMYPTIAF